jgi:hypothetical protein
LYVPSSIEAELSIVKWIAMGVLFMGASFILIWKIPKSSADSIELVWIEYMADMILLYSIKSFDKSIL